VSLQYQTPGFVKLIKIDRLVAVTVQFLLVLQAT